MAYEQHARARWDTPFFDALRAGLSIPQASERAGVNRTAPHNRKRRDPAFAASMADALAVGAATHSGEGTQGRGGPWTARFLEALAATSNVSASAIEADTNPRVAYALRRNNPGFAKQWLAALAEGYDNLELELLGFLRDPQPDRKIDVAAGLRLLAAHRETIARERAFRGEASQVDTYASIDRFIGRLRDARLKAGKPLIELEPSGKITPELAPQIAHKPAEGTSDAAS